MKRALIVVAKEPSPGKTKTRLTPPLTLEEAVDLYRGLLLDTLELMRQVDGVRPVIAYAPAEARAYFRRVAAQEFDLTPQVGANLGERLHNVLSAYLQRGYQQVVVMNSDGPTLPVEYLRMAFANLDDPTTDVVIGPSDDGGYYLIGLKRPHAALFDVVMSTPTVLQETLAQAQRQRLRAVCLPAWYDVDTLDDLRRMMAELASVRPETAPRTRAFLARMKDL